VVGGSGANVGVCSKLRRSPDAVTHLEGWIHYSTSDKAVVDASPKEYNFVSCADELFHVRCFELLGLRAVIVVGTLSVRYTTQHNIARGTHYQSNTVIWPVVICAT